jgi:glycosyltransferase involved in cell wall biosynthesis
MTRHGRALPQITVVTAARDIAAFIGATIDSVIGQTLADLEMIVVDDGSKDETAGIVGAVVDPRVRLISIPASGVSVARNLGLAEARAPLVVFLDGDDLLCRDALAQMVATMAAHPGRVACFGHHVKLDEHDRLLGSRAPARFKSLPAQDTLRHLLCRNFIVNGGALCIRTEAARRVGGFDPGLRFSEDLEFWCRLAVLSDFVAIDDQVVLQYRMRRAGANVMLAGTPLHPNVAALDTIYAAPAVRERFSAYELRRYRRLADANKHWSAARNALIRGRLAIFARYLVAGGLRYPETVLRWRLIYIFFRGLPLPWRAARPATLPDPARSPPCSEAPSFTWPGASARR